MSSMIVGAAESASGSGGNSGTRGGDGGGPCGACKFLRRKCVKGCIFAPHFNPEPQGMENFAAVHKVFGASNVSKLLQQVPSHKCNDAAMTICYEANARLSNPTMVWNLQMQLTNMQTSLATMQLPSQPQFTTQPQMPMIGESSVSNLPSSSNILAPVDSSSFVFDQQMQSQFEIELQQAQNQLLHQQQFVQGGGSGLVDGTDLQGMARLGGGLI